MNLNKVRPRNDTKDLLLSITENCDTLIEQTHRKTEETLEVKLNKPKEIFHFNPPMAIKGSWMLELKSLQDYKSIFYITEKNNKLELYTDTFDELSSTELNDEVEEILSISDITPYHFQYEKIGPRIMETCRKLESEKSSTDE